MRFGAVLADRRESASSLKQPVSNANGGIGRRGEEMTGDAAADSMNRSDSVRSVSKASVQGGGLEIP